MDINEVLNDIEQKLVNLKISNTRKLQFRCSGLPICPVSWIFGEAIHEGDIPSKEDFYSDFYTSVGTEVHLVLQRWLARTGLLYGNWRCENNIPPSKKVSKVLRDNDLGKSIKKYKRKCNYFIENCTGPQTCPKCNSEMVYEEFVVGDPETGLSGHVDACFVCNDGFIIADFKTTGVTKFAELEEPDEGYVEQINAYANMLSRPPYNFKIYGLGIWYIQRDSPRNSKVFLWEKFSKKNYEYNLKQFKIIAELKKSNYKGIHKYRICPDIDSASGCPYQSFCFTPKLSKLVRSYFDMRK